MNKKVLIASYSYPPDNNPAAQRAYFFSKYLESNGWSPVVLTAKNSDSSLGQSVWAEAAPGTQVVNSFSFRISRLRGIKTEAFRRDEKTGGIVVNFFKFIYRALSELSIPDKAMIWIPGAVIQGCRILKKDKEIRALFSTSPAFSNHVAAFFIKFFFNLPWVVDIRDFHYLENLEKKSFFFKKKINRFLENQVIKKADRLIFINEDMRKRYLERYQIVESKTTVIYNGFDSEEFEPHFPISANKPLTITYAGSLYAGERSLAPLLFALERLLEKKSISTDQISVEIVGSVEGVSLEEIKKLNIYQSVKLLGILGRKEVIYRIKNSHLLWLILGESFKHSQGFPVKGYEYLGARRPILVFAPEGAPAAKIISELKCGTIFKNGSSETDQVENAKLLERYIKEFKDSGLNNPLVDDSASKLKFTRRYQTKQLAELLDKLVLETR